MLRNDSIISGLIVGLSVFAIAAFLLTNLNNWFATNYAAGGVRTQFVFILALMFNLLPLHIFNNQQRGQSMRGIVFATLIAIVGILYYFRDSIY